MEKVKNRILDIFVENRIIKEEDRDIYEFGLITMFFTLGKFLLLFVIFLILGEVTGFVTFILGFCILRYYSGGYHVSSATLCALLTFILIYITIVISKVCFLNGWTFVPLLCVLISIPLVFIFAPGKVKNRPLKDEERTKFRYMSRKMVIILSLIILIVSISPYKSYELYVFSLGLLFQSINIISKKEDSNEAIVIN